MIRFWSRPSRCLRAIAGIVLLGLGACAPAAVSPPRGHVKVPSGPATAWTVPKVVTMAARQERLSFVEFRGIGSSGGGNASVRRIAHNYLVVLDHQRAYRPQLATELPSVE